MLQKYGKQRQQQQLQRKQKEKERARENVCRQYLNSLSLEYSNFHFGDMGYVQFDQVLWTEDGIFIEISSNPHEIMATIAKYRRDARKLPFSSSDRRQTHKKRN